MRKFEPAQKITNKHKERILAAMKAAGYEVDYWSMNEDYMTFSTEYGVVYFERNEHKSIWNELDEWLCGVVFEDPDVAEKVEYIMTH